MAQAAQGRSGSSLRSPSITACARRRRGGARGEEARRIACASPHTTLRWSGAKPSRGIARRRARSALCDACQGRAQGGRGLHPHGAYARRPGRDVPDAPVARQRTRRACGDGAAIRARRGGHRAAAAGCAEGPADRDARRRRRFAFADDPTNRDDNVYAAALAPADARACEGRRRRAQHRAGWRRGLRARTRRSKRSPIAPSRRSCSATASGRRIDVDAFLTLPDEIRLAPAAARDRSRRTRRAGRARQGRRLCCDELTDALAHKALRSFRRTLAGALVEVGRGMHRHRACATAPHSAKTLKPLLTEWPNTAIRHEQAALNSARI